MVSAVEEKCNYFIGDKHHHRKIKLLCIMLPKASVLPKASAYVKSYDGKIKWI